MSSTLRTHLDTEGYVLIPSLLESHQISTLRTACSHLHSLAEAGKWPYLRTLPKQFPPWGSDPSVGIWGIQHLLHPDNIYSGLFATTYFSDSIIKVVRDLLSCTEEDLVMELYNLLITPTRDFSLRWHRDDISPSATAEEEVAALSRPAWHAQWNLALYDDESLIVVPGSHKRARSDEERAMDPYECSVPGQRVVKLKTGDAVFYDNNILHRGVYDADVPRMTLHGSIGHVAGEGARARNVLQHGVGEWVRRCEFSGLQEEDRGRAKGMRERLLETGGANENVGFSQSD